LQALILSILTHCNQPLERPQLRLYRPLLPNINAEIVATAKHRLIPNADIRRIMLCGACTKSGEIGTLMCREGSNA
jgi:hypothetical protein